MKLEIENLSVSIGRTSILKGVSLAVEAGEFLSLLGPSGCGKSTLLKAVAGLLPLEEGRVSMDGRDLAPIPVHRRRAVILFQDMRLFPHLTVLENVAFPLKMQGTPRAERNRAAEALLERVELGEYARRRPGELSGGQQQRAALARALVARPELLMLDEPFSALDENLREGMRALVKELHRDFHMTTVLVTHDREEALSLSDRVAVMFEGRIVQTGTPREVYRRPAARAVADYFGNCGYLRGRVEAGVFTCPCCRCAAAVPDGTYDLMLRGEALCPGAESGIPVTVSGVQFKGAETRVLFAGADGQRWSRTFREAPPWRVGERLTAGVDPGEGVLFPAEG